MFEYLAFLALVFIPGLLFTFIFLPKKSSFPHIFSAACGIGLAALVLLSFAISYLGYYSSPTLLIFYILVCLAGLIFTVLKKSWSEIKFGTIEIILIGLLILHFILLELHFAKYPIFPMSWEPDFWRHLTYSTQLQTGILSVNELPPAPGVQLIIASGFSFISGEKLVIMQQIMVLVTLLQLPLVYLVAEVATSKRSWALFITSIYAFSPIFWNPFLYQIGLYANILGNIFSLLLIYLIFTSLQTKSKRLIIPIILTTISLLLSHSTIFLLLATVMVFLVIKVVKERSLMRNMATTAGSIILGAVLTFLIKPSLLTRLPATVSIIYPRREIEIVIKIDDPIYQILGSASPFLSIFYSFTGRWGFFVIIACLVALAIETVRRRRVNFELFSILWFLSAWLVSLGSGSQVWRFSLYSVLPSIFIIGVPLSKFLERIEKQITPKNVSLTVKSINITTIKMISIALLTISGGILGYFADIALAGTVVSERQRGIYDSIVWIRENTPDDARFVSISLKEFRSIPFLTGRQFLGYYAMKPEQLLKEVAEKNVSHVIVWNWLDEGGYTRLYQEDAHFRKLWANDVVTIFSIVQESSRTSS